MASERDSPDGTSPPHTGSAHASETPSLPYPGDVEPLDLYPGERDGTNESLRRERDFWKYLFESLVYEYPEGAMVVDDEGTLTHWNSAHEDIAGIAIDEAVGETAYDVLGTEGEEETLAETIARTGEAVREEKVRSGGSPDGDRWHIRAAGVPLRSPEGEVVGAFEIVSEVTSLIEQRRRLEELQEQMTEEVEVAVEDLFASAEQVSGSSEQIGEIASEQAENLEEISAEVERLSATIEEIASSAETVNRTSQEAAELADESREAAGTTLEHVEAIAESGEVLSENTQDLRDRIDEVHGIVHAIDDIADQTNLLALNASIEAARSADGGAGFAVVADEVKALAEQSKEEAAEIEGIVSAITDNVETTAENVTAANDRIERAVDQIGTLMENQEAIEGAVDETSVGMEEIADATGEQSRSAEEVTDSLARAVSGVNEVSAEIQELAAANERQVGKVSDIRESLDRIETHLRESADTAEFDD